MRLRHFTLSILLAATLPMSTITAQESVAIINYHKNSTVGIIYRVTGEYRPITANNIDEILEKYPEIDKSKFLAMILQESSFNKDLVKNGDWGLCQVHLAYWRDEYMIDETNILNERVNLHVGADIWVNYAGQDYGNYCYGVKHKGEKPNVDLYNKKLKIIKGMV